MDHRIGSNLPDVPQVGRVVRPEEGMCRAFPPAVEADFERAHVVFPGQHRPLFVPHDALAEVQPALLQYRRIVAEIGIAAPDVERATGFQHARDVAEPCGKELVELRVGLTLTLYGGSVLTR